MKTLSIDIETFSSGNIGDCGAYKYIDSPDFEILLFGYSIDYGKVEVVDLAQGETIPPEVLAMLTDEAVLKTAYNAAFERAALTKFVGQYLPPEQWSCTMVLAASFGYPLGLEKVSEAMNLPPDKAKADGKALIRYFCMPCKPTIVNKGRTRNLPAHAPDKWERFVEYNRRDVEAENEIRIRLEARNRFDSVQEDRFYSLDQRINDKGVKLDVQLIENAIDFNDRYVSGLIGRAQALTGIDNVKSTAQIKEWLGKEEGKGIESLNKKAMPDLLNSLTSDKSRELLALRAEISKTSVTKFEKMITCLCDDDHARGLFQFYGASRTGRFAGRLIQLQNLPQNHLPDIAEARALVRAGLYDETVILYENITSLLSELIRTAIVPEDGSRFIVADFSAIEARVIAWYAKEHDDLEEFRGKGKIYEVTAARMFGVPMEKIKKGNPEYALRAKGKVATLACGYGGSVGALKAMGALNSGVTEDELPGLVRKWRDAHKHITSWWYSLEAAAIECLRTKASAKDDIGGVIFDYEDGTMFMRLASERRIAYVGAKLGVNNMGRDCIYYMGSNQTTHKWEQLETYYGKLAENCVQATARDCLRECMLNLADAGFDIRAHVHDEVIINEPKDGRTLDDVIEIMRRPPDWAPDLPLNAAGFESEFYMKD